MSPFVNLLTRVNLSAFKMAVVAVCTPRWKCGKCELLPFTVDLVKRSDFSPAAPSAGKKKIYLWKGNKQRWVHQISTDIKEVK